MQTMSLIHVFKVINDNRVITNEVGTAADVAYVVKQASARVINFTSAPMAELMLAA